MPISRRAAQRNELKKFIEETFQAREIKDCFVDGKWNREKIKALCEARNIGDKAGDIHEYLCRIYGRTRRVVIAAFALFVLAWLNAWSFVIVTTCIGGDAAHGKCENGRYYLRMKKHYTEVSRGVWLYSKIHGTSVVIGLPLGMCAMGAVFFSAGRERERRHPRHHQLLLRRHVGSAVRITVAVIVILMIAALWLWIAHWH